MSLNQFTPAAERADFQRNESNPLTNVTAEQFADLMKMVEAAHGTPRSPKMLHVFSTDAEVLNRRSKEQFGAVDSLFAIGAMPDSIPADVRRASLRGQIHTELSPQELEKVAQTEGISVEELKKDENFDPYFNLKVVLVEEDGELKVGYFEFLPAVHDGLTLWLPASKKARLLVRSVGKNGVLSREFEFPLHCTPQIKSAAVGIQLGVCNGGAISSAQSRQN